MSFKRKPVTADFTYKLGGQDKNGKAMPKEIKGYYYGYTTVVNEFGPSRRHTFKTLNGIEGIWGASDLNKQLETWPLGTMIIATHLGTKKKIGKFSGFAYDVQGDEDDVDEVPVEYLTRESQSSVVSHNSNEDVSDGETGADSDALDEVTPSRATVPHQPVASPSPAAQARTKALLAKGARA